MKAFLVLLLIAASPLCAAAESAFTFSDLTDVPLMAGLQEIPDNAFIFDKPEGTIAETAAFSDSLTPDAVEGFYNRALSEMGWAEKGQGVYMRQSQGLRVIVKPQQNGGSMVHYLLFPWGQNAVP